MEFGSTTVIADLEAGIGTLTRLADQEVDAVLVVVEPTPKSIEVGVRAVGLVEEKSLGRVVVVASRVQGEEDLATIRAAFPGQEVVPVPVDRAIEEADRHGLAPLDTAPDAPAVRALVSLAEGLLPAPA
ncbi:MAG: hypothetical protein ACRDZ9_09915 [Acidimicrobiales bacterium]